MDDENIKEISIGYASSLCEGLDNKDSFLLVDLTAVFRGKKHRIILCTIVKGLAKCVDGAVLVGGLLSEILGPHQPDYKEHLVNIRKKFKEQVSTLFTSCEASKETGLLVSVIDNAQISTLCINLPCTFMINKTLKQVIKGTEKPDAQMCTLEKGDVICLACCDILTLEGEKDTLNTISNANSLQIACSTLMSNIQKKKPGCDVSLAIAQVK